MARAAPRAPGGEVDRKSGHPDGGHLSPFSSAQTLLLLLGFGSPSLLGPLLLWVSSSRRREPLNSQGQLLSREAGSERRLAHY